MALFWGSFSNGLTESFLTCMFFHSIIVFQVQYRTLAQQLYWENIISNANLNEEVKRLSYKS